MGTIFCFKGSAEFHLWIYYNLCHQFFIDGYLGCYQSFASKTMLRITLNNLSLSGEFLSGVQVIEGFWHWKWTRSFNISASAALGSFSIGGKHCNIDWFRKIGLYFNDGDERISSKKKKILIWLLCQGIRELNFRVKEFFTNSSPCFDHAP